MSPARTRRAPSPVQDDEQLPSAPRLDPAEAQAFTEQARWLHDYHEKRSAAVVQRAATLLGFVGVTTALMPAGFSLGKDNIDFTEAVRTTVVAVLVLLLLSAGCCLRTLALRKATVPKGGQLRDQWNRYARGGSRGLVHAQIAHSYLGGHDSVDPVAAASDEADSRVVWLKWALRLLAVAIVALAALTGQILLQQA